MRNPAVIAVNRTQARLVALLASVTLGLLMVRHSAARQAEQRRPR